MLAPKQKDSKERVFEIRTYTTEPGKLPDLLNLFRDPVIKIFKRHGLTAFGYWLPTDQPRSPNTIIYILVHDSRSAAKKSWADFKSDPEWIKARKESESGGKIFHKIESVFADATNFSETDGSRPVPPTVPATNRVFEIRTYTTEPGKLPDLLERFRDHTTKLFEKHGMTNIGYWVPTDELLSKNTLICILAHDSRDAAKQSWNDFQADPDWKKVKYASEANGKIVTNFESVFAAPTDFSAIK